jgi:serine/threonine protein kinase
MHNYTNFSLKYENYPEKIYTAIHKQERVKYIVKLVKHDPLDGQELAMEVEVHLRLEHSHIARMKEYFRHEEEGINYWVIVLEHCSGGNIERFVSSIFIGEWDIYKKVLQIALAIQYLHQHNIVHKDIKIENILLSRGKLKIVDLGLAEILDGRYH